MNELTIKIGEKQYVIKQSFRALMLFEDLTKRKLSEMQESVNDIMTLFYCIVKANNKDFNLSLNDFIDLIDDNADTFEIFTNFLQSQANNEAIENTDKKKVKKK